MYTLLILAWIVIVSGIAAILLYVVGFILAIVAAIDAGDTVEPEIKSEIVT